MSTRCVKIQVSRRQEVSNILYNQQKGETSMRAFSKATIVTIMMAVCAGVFSIPAMAEIKLGVLAPRGELVANKEWGEMAKHFGNELGEPVKLVPLAVAKLVDGVKNGEVDYFIANSVQMVVLAEKHGAKPLATLSGMEGPVFAGVIVAKKGSGIVKAEHLKGKHVMTLGDSAAGGYVFQAYHLLKKGISMKGDIGKRTQGVKQDDLVRAVGAGLADAAFIRTGVLEAMDKEGKINKDDFVVVDERKTAGFDLRHTTVMYPEWYLGAGVKTPAAQVERIKKSALAVKPKSPAATAANVQGFVETAPLGELKNALKALNLPPYGG